LPGVFATRVMTICNTRPHRWGDSPKVKEDKTSGDEARVASGCL
jgi:hypothetical protein